MLDHVKSYFYLKVEEAVNGYDENLFRKYQHQAH